MINFFLKLTLIVGVTASLSFGMSESQEPKKMMKMFQTVLKSEATMLQKGKTKAFCPECGMTLSMFYKTNHTAQKNHKVKQYCSIHCLVEDMDKGKIVEQIQVVDTNSLKFIEAKKAFYVINSSKKGTMTQVSKYAFSSQEAASIFAKKYGGYVGHFTEALNVAKNDFKKDNVMIAKKQKMMAKKGAMLYAKFCQKTQNSFDSTALAKSFIVENKLCHSLNGKQLQAVGIYLKNK